MALFAEWLARAIRADDANGDRRVDNADFFQLRSTFGRSAGDPLYLAYFDFNNDRRVDNLDLFQLRSRFGTTQP